MSGSGSFEQTRDDLDLASPPSAKRARYEATELAPEPATEIVTEGEGGEMLTVPQTQFEIEINSGTVEDEDDVSREAMLRQELAGPAFAITTAAQDFPPLNTLPLRPQEEPAGEKDGSTLNAISRALIQMQQTGGGTSQPGSTHQLILTSPQGEVGHANSSSLYVMIPPSNSAEILQAMGQTRPIAPKGETAMSPDRDGVSNTREAQRKATHNEVERRRRDRINDMIKTLAQIVPGCQKKDTSTGNVVGYVYSKGTVLDKTVEYLKDLIAQNEQLASTAKLAEKSANALSLLQNQIAVLEKENAFLRAQIIQLGIDATTSSQTAALSRQLLNTPLAQSLLNTPPSQPPLSQPPPSTSTTHNATQQLILSLAQTLSGNSLLGQSIAAAPVSLTPSPITTPSPPRAPLTSLTPSQLVSSLTSVSPSLPASIPPLHSSSSSSSSLQTSLTTPLLNSLVQTLASIANTSTTSSTPLPKVTPLPTLSSQAQGLSATAAANLLNTLLLAQNVLNIGSGQGEGGANVANSVLNPVTMENEQPTS